MAKESTASVPPKQEEVVTAPKETVASLLDEIQLDLLRAIRDAASPKGSGVDVTFAGQASDVYLKLFGED